MSDIEKKIQRDITDALIPVEKEEWKTYSGQDMSATGSWVYAPENTPSWLSSQTPYTFKVKCSIHYQRIKMAEEQTLITLKEAGIEFDSVYLETIADAVTSAVGDFLEVADVIWDQHGGDAMRNFIRQFILEYGLTSMDGQGYHPITEQ